MKILYATLIAALSLMASPARALDANLDLTGRIMMGDNHRYPVRADIVTGLDVGKLYVDDLLHWDRAGVTKDGKKEFPLTVLNNKLTVGYDVWKGLGPVYQRGDITDQDGVNRVGAAYNFKTGFLGFRLSTKTMFFFTDDADTNLRFEEGIMLKHKIGLFVYDSYYLEFAGGPHKANNKLYVGYEVYKNASVVVQRNDVTDRNPVYRVGLQIKFL